MMKNWHLSSALQPDSVWKNWHSGGCQYSQGDCVLPRILLFPRHTSTSCRWWLRRCGGSVFWFLRKILGLVPETARVSLRTLAFFFPLITGTFSSINAWQSHSTLYHCSWFNSPHAWRRSFAIEVSDLYSSSSWFSTFDSWEPMSSNESPCRTIRIRFWVDQTHVSSICTDIPRFHRMEFLTSMTELHPILYRIPECCHHEE